MPREIRVLHVDDDPELVALVGEYIERERESLTVLTESDPTAVIDRIESDPVDCVVSDYQMPRLDGLTLLEQVRATRPDLPFILFTGRGSEAVASSAISAGVTDYIQKGGTETYELLANRIEKAVDRQRAHREVERVQQGFRLVADAADDAIFSVGEDGTVLYVNPGIERLLGYDAEELLGRSMTDLLADQSPADSQTGSPVADGGDDCQLDDIPTDELRTIPFDATHADGHAVPIDASITAIDLGDRRICTGVLRNRE